MTATPMFPLGSVVFPHTGVPLVVFEDRYHALLDHVMSGDRRFGTVLIERGHEVGGGDERFSIGTMVEVVAAGDVEEGRRAIVVAGSHRIEVRRWTGEEPFPTADVEELPDADRVVTLDEVDATRKSLDRVLALASELGADIRSLDLDVAEDPVTASYQLAALAPVATIDSYRLLESPGPSERLALARSLLEDQAEVLRSQLAQP